MTYQDGIGDRHTVHGLSGLHPPLLTDTSIDWGQLSPMEVSTDTIPDVFTRYSIRLLGHYTQAGNHTIEVHGKVNGRQATLPLHVSLQEQSTDGQAIALIWARGKIKRLMNELAIQQGQRPSGMHDDHIKQSVTDLGLTYALATQWTAFVAVTERIYNSAPELSDNSQVPMPMVKGVIRKADGQTNVSAFHGNCAPEPGGVIGLLLLSMMLGTWMLLHWSGKTIKA